MEIGLSFTILAIGDELLAGKTVDTNSAWIARELDLDLKEVRLVKDEQELIQQALEDVLPKGDFLITTGGLGPTSDDLTRQAIAAFVGQELEQDDTVLAKLERHSLKKGRPLYPSGRRQALFPRGAQIIPNELGTADAFRTPCDKRHIISLPGVPREMRALIKEQVIPWIERSYSRPKKHQKYLRCFGVSEAFIGQTLEDAKLDVPIAYRPQFPVVLVTLSAPSEDAVLRAQEQAQSVLGDYVFADSEEDTLASVLGDLLRLNSKTVSFAESCSGGEIANLMVATAGCSDYFLSSVVAYSNSAKQEFLGVRADTLKKHGAVSAEVALEMAHGVRERSKSDIAVSTTGIAGPAGGTKEKPQGTVWLAVVAGNFEQAFCYQLPFERNGFRRYSAMLALDKVRRYLLGYAMEWQRK